MKCILVYENILELTRGAGSTEGAFAPTASLGKAGSRYLLKMKDLLKIFKYLRIFQKMTFWDPLEFTTPTDNAQKRAQKLVPKCNSAQMPKFSQKVDFRGFFLRAVWSRIAR